MANVTQAERVSPLVDLAELFDLQQQIFTSMTRGAARVVEGPMKLNSELLAFMQKRIGQDIALTEALCACRSPAEAADACGEFYRRAFGDYAGEAIEMTQMTAGLARETVDLSAYARPKRGDGAARLPAN